jgi:hypothetical protein
MHLVDPQQDITTSYLDRTAMGADWGSRIALGFAFKNTALLQENLDAQAWLVRAGEFLHYTMLGSKAQKY